MSRIAAVAPVLPEHAYSQARITEELAPLLTSSPSTRAVLERLHAASGIGTRHTALPLERYRELSGFREANDLFIQCATDLAERAVTDALARAGLAARDVDFMLFTSVTGVSAPSIDAALVPRLGMRPDVKRLPSFGLGCVAGAAGIARVHDYLQGHPTEVGLLVSVELCSLTLQRGDATVGNYVATGLFGDGGAAVVLVGDERDEPGAVVRGTRSALIPDSADVIGFTVGGTGFEIVLTPAVAEVIARHFPREVDSVLADHGLATTDVAAWIAHPGGPRVLEAFEGALGISRADLDRSWACLDRVGNLSSAAVLHVLADTLDSGVSGPALLFALGPGVSAEFVVVELP